MKAGHALQAIGTPEARAALRAGIDDHEYIAQVLAVRTMFTDEGDPWDNMSWLFTEARLARASGTSAAWRVLACFCDSGRGPKYDLVSTDRRWLGLCISLRDYDSLAPAAREALRLADPAVTRPALGAARQVQEEQARPLAGSPQHKRCLGRTLKPGSTWSSWNRSSGCRCRPRCPPSGMSCDR